MRKFACPHCGFVKVLAGRELRKFRKRLSGFTCTNCKKKVSPYDLAKQRGEGPKPKGERRKRVKKEVVVDTSPIVVHTHIEQFEWRSDPPPPGEPRRYVARAGWQPKPTTRTLEEVLVEAHLSKMTREVDESG